MLIKLEDVVDLPPEPHHTQRIQFPYNYRSFGTPVLHAGVARLSGSKLGHGLSLQCFTARIAVHGINTIDSSTWNRYWSGIEENWEHQE